jgi:hypothetical protein
MISLHRDWMICYMKRVNMIQSLSRGHRVRMVLIRKWNLVPALINGSRLHAPPPRLLLEAAGGVVDSHRACQIHTCLSFTPWQLRNYRNPRNRSPREMYRQPTLTSRCRTRKRKKIMSRIFPLRVQRTRNRYPHHQAEKIISDALGVLTYHGILHLKKDSAMLFWKSGVL